MRVLPLVAISAAFAADYQVIPDIEYTRPNGVSVKMDAHVPPGKGPFPTVIIVHGGGWTKGHKTVNFVTPLFDPLTSAGFTWFTIDYRLAPQYPYPAAVDDVEAAVAFVKKHAKEYKADPKRIAILGESAGGHLVNLVGAKNRVGVAGVVCFYGPIDMVEFSKRFKNRPLGGMKDFFSIDALDEKGMAVMREASPATYINKKTPPFLVIHGTKDEAVAYEQAKLHVELFKKHGIPVELFTVEDGVHGVMNWEKDPKFHAYKKAMVDWLRKTLK